MLPILVKPLLAIFDEDDLLWVIFRLQLGYILMVRLIIGCKISAI